MEYLLGADEVVADVLVLLEEGPSDLAFLLLLVGEYLGIYSVLQLELSLQLRLPLPLPLLELVLYPLRLHSRPLHRLLLVPTPPQEVLLPLLLHLVGVGRVLPKLERVQVLAEDLQIDIPIAPPPESME
jgi:hypothetical protein